MVKIAALVEGHTETHFINATFPKPHFQRPFPNGKDVSLDLIAESISDALEVVGGEIDAILVLLDREGRAITAQDMAVELSGKLKKLGCNRKIHIGVTDRHLENWILADQEAIREKFQREDFFYAGDGTRGKAILESVAGYAMSPIDKARLLKSCSAIRAKTRSQSLLSWLDSCDFEWHWAIG